MRNVPENIERGRLPHDVIEMTIPNNSDFEAMTAKAKAMFEVNEVHKKVRPGKPHGFDGFSSHQATRRNHQIDQGHRIVGFAWRFHDTAIVPR